MPVLKCKMCGGSLEISTETSVIECDYCGSKQTLPKLDNERKAMLFDRANYYRLKNEFDKAAGIYESIISEDSDNPEAHWGVCLCRYGIEYVVDPKTGKRVPTCHRTQFASILNDSDYTLAISNADYLAKQLYVNEAEYIDKVQKEILSISSSEEPYDIFICYKETDENGERTVDSVEAQKMYKELTKEGYRVFFSRISLEDKLGTAYEPYIFAALNSAQVMIVVGTKAEYLTSPWVKNEWSRFLSLIEQGKNVRVIPCYKNMVAEELPDELAYFQGLDMSKIAYEQDLNHAVSKIISRDSKKDVSPKTNEASNSVQELLISDGTGMYVGETFAGQPHGKGKCTYKNGSFYNGEWKFGQYDGFGKFIFNSEDKESSYYEGEYCEGVYHGQGTLFSSGHGSWSGEWKDGVAWNGTGVVSVKVREWFEGDIVDGQCTGFGKLTFFDNSYYEGTFKDGVFSGKGKFVFATDRVYALGTRSFRRTGANSYEGEFSNGAFNGCGVLQYNDGTSWEGTWNNCEEWTGTGTRAYDNCYYGEIINGERTGHGKTVFSNGDYYEGEYVKGKRHGQGVYYRKDGNKWSGEWKNGNRWNGVGYTWDKKGRAWNGEWIDGKKWSGLGFFTYNDGCTYDGELRDGKRNGVGTLTWNSGKVTKYTKKEGDYNEVKVQTWTDRPSLSGEWKDNQIWSGDGVWYYTDARYDGHWENGKRNGQGTLTWGKADYSEHWYCWKGEWRDDIAWNGDGQWHYKSQMGYGDGFKKYPRKNGKEPSKGCYIATCVYGSYNCPQVWTLRRFRDDVLLKCWYGRLFVNFYYVISPKLVKWLGTSRWFRKLFEKPLNKLVASLQNRGISDTPYEDK